MHPPGPIALLTETAGRKAEPPGLDKAEPERRDRRRAGPDGETEAERLAGLAALKVTFVRS